MKEQVMASDWRTVQMFLTVNGVFEVEVDLEGMGVRCTCPGFKLRSSCKHSKLVGDRLEENNGIYPLKVSAKASIEEAKQAKQSAGDFREFVLRYGKVEVI